MGLFDKIIGKKKTEDKNKNASNKQKETDDKSVKIDNNENSEIEFKNIVKNSKDKFARYDAVSKITDVEFLKEVAINEPDLSDIKPLEPCPIANEAVMTLYLKHDLTNDEETYMDILKNAKCFSVRGTIVQRCLNDEDTLVEVVKNDSSFIVRRYAVEKLSSDFKNIKKDNLTVLVDVATNYPYYKVRELIMELISKQDKNLLKEIIDNTPYEDGKSLAKSLL